jgi:pimeloyl-ACP methyl ester carboxylesterase
MPPPVIAMPGVLSPAAIRFAPVQAALGGTRTIHLKDLELYAGDSISPTYSIDDEVKGLTRFADSVGARQFHLLAYSGGGFISLAFAGTHPERLLSLTLFEPARIPGPLTSEEAAFDARLQSAMAGLEGPQMVEAFIRMQVRPGVQVPPPSGPPQPWMRNRPAGIMALSRAFAAYRFDREQLRRAAFPVLLSYGDQTAEIEEIKAAILARLFPRITIRRWPGIHHFLPPEQIYSGEHIAAIQRGWALAEGRLAVAGGTSP